MNDVMRTNHRRAQTLIYKLDAATDAMSTTKVIAGPPPQKEGAAQVQ